LKCKVFCFWGDIYRSLQGGTRGGGELQIALIAENLARKGHRVLLIDFSVDKDIEMNAGISVLSLNQRIKFRFFKFFYFYKMLQTANANFYYGRIRSSIHLFGYLASRKNGANFILGLAHDLDTCGFIERYQKFYKQRSFMTFIKHIVHSELVFEFLLKRADFIIAQHNGQRKKLLNRGIPSWICKNIYDPFTLTKENTRNDEYTFVGSLDKRKGIDSIALIVKYCPTSNFKIIGRCRDRYSLDVIEEIKLLPNVQYLGQLDHQIAKEEVGRSTALISVSLMEGFPNTFIEAWAQGVPVLSLHVDPDELLQSHKLGIFCHSSIEYLIESILQNRIIQFESKKMIDYIRENHSAKNNISRFLNIIGIDE
jgi:hypothetical protein